MLRQAAMISDAGSGCWWLPGRRTVDGGRLWGQRLSLLRVCSLCEMSSNLVKAFMESEIIQGSCLRMKKMIHSSVKSPTPSWRQAAGEERPWAPVGDFRGGLALLGGFCRRGLCTQAGRWVGAAGDIPGGQDQRASALRGRCVLHSASSGAPPLRG